MSFSPPSGVFMSVIYMDFYSHSRDDMILSMTPLILLLFISHVDAVLQYLIVAIIISNVTYWNYKNVYTFTLDSMVATIFIAYLFYKCIESKRNLYVLFILLFAILYYFRISYIKGRKGERQLYEHVAFRSAVFALFLYYVLSEQKNGFLIKKSWPFEKKLIYFFTIDWNT